MFGQPELRVTKSHALLLNENQTRTHKETDELHCKITYLSLAWNFRKFACSCSANYIVCFFFLLLPHREAVSNFLTALSLQRKSRNQQQVPHPALSGNIWAALRIALSMMDQPELFQAANVGDLDILLRAFNLEP